MRNAAFLGIVTLVAAIIPGPSSADVAFVGQWTGQLSVPQGRPVPATLIVNEAGDYKLEYWDKRCVVMLERAEPDTEADEDSLLFRQKVVHGRCAHDALISLARTGDPDQVKFSSPDEPLTGTLERITAESPPRPEHGSERVRLRTQRGKVHEFLYREAGLPSGSDAGIGVEPIDVLHQQLADEKYKCIYAVTLNVGNSRMIVKRRTTRLTFNQFGYKRYVVHCTGDCDGLEYQVQTSSEIVHFASTSPVPMIAMQSRYLGSSSLYFHVPAAAVGRDAVVRIFQWTRDPGDYGLGCGASMRG